MVSLALPQDRYSIVVLPERRLPKSVQHGLWNLKKLHLRRSLPNQMIFMLYLSNSIVRRKDAHSNIQQEELIIIDDNLRLRAYDSELALD